MTNKQKLELTWIGKEKKTRLEPRLLLEDASTSYTSDRAGMNTEDNLVISGDNLLGLKALEGEYLNKIKCVYIDPPYNTGTAFESYDDGLEHSMWLSMMKSRLEIIWKLLSEDNGVLLISINDDELHYLKVLCDDLFGRDKFIANLVWNYEGNTDNQAKIINYHEYVLVYSKTGKIDDPSVFDPNISQSSKLFKSEIRNTIVKNGPKNPPKSVVIPKGFPCNFDKGTICKDDVQWPKYSDDLIVEDGKLCAEVTANTGWSSRAILESFIESNFNAVLDSKKQSTVFELTKTGAIEAVKKREQKKGHFVSVLRGFGTTNQMRLLLSKLGIKFSYPKPVNLISYLIEAFTDDGDIILDSFAGSGTTGHAVLQLNKEKNTNRRFILIELRDETVKSVILPRIKAVIEGNKQAGLEPHYGGFRSLYLAPSLLQKDEWGNWVINKEYNAEMLAAAMCKHMGFTYAPNDTQFWNQGYSTETDFIYVTTGALAYDQLKRISEEVGEERTLLICCKAFMNEGAEFPNLTIKKIPQSILNKCEWDNDDYSFTLDVLAEDNVEQYDEEEE
ncbi:MULTISPECIES: site-specific DNA-methyltransferase [Vibrio]|uniref:site-specific DNA-methyltransferase n=1 Tax=Vibrio TaxID=662 RepID=UPI000C84D2CA|nr:MULTISPECIES: site-specific DNA-methyltransferase [Vibrio]KAB0463725.1 site-specific DNA-methyltransferase [Vibrio kanaloae]PMI42833.1 hypothetical protein BCU44_20105 [Vibrio cyclitrophicus]PMJ37006.1 hypothetical protein BCU25_03700 [Vibrio cyclitrophicus]